MKNVLSALAIVAALAACDSPEQKAAKYYAQAQELVAQGDNQRALVELRNALQNDPGMRDARILFAQLLEKANRLSDAYGQYLDVMERNPGDPVASRALTLIAIDALAWDEAAKYLKIASAANPNDNALKAVQTALDFRAGALAHNADAMNQAASSARALMEQDPSLQRTRLVVLSNLLRQKDYHAALEVVDAGLALNADDYELNKIKLVALQQLNRIDDFETQLLKLVDLHPQDADMNRMLVQFYLQTGRADAAEERLRAQIRPESNDPAPRLTLLDFLAQIRSPDAMRSELDTILAQNPLAPDVAANLYKFQTLRAQATFAAGQRDKAQADLENIIQSAEPSTELDEMKINLAQMRQGTGNLDGAKTLVEEVIARDPGQVDALKMKAQWLTDADQTDQALTILRDALANAPSDPSIFTLMASAYQRSGQVELIPEMLSRAAEVSGYAPTESINYANYLARQKQYEAAATVLNDARNAKPDNFDVMAALARVHVWMQNWPLVNQDIAILGQQFNTDESQALQNELRAQLLRGQGKSEQLSKFLTELARSSGTSIGPQISVIQNTVATGDLDQAFEQATDLSNKNPDAVEPKMMIAQILLAQDKQDEAVGYLRELTAATPSALAAWQLLQTVQLGEGDAAGALTTINAALVALPDQRDLMGAKAIALEKTGDVEGAIALYETLYQADTKDALTANNLASLLATARDDDASLDRAWIISRRLNGNPLPAFQDTVGWIAFRRGELDDAIRNLEGAAKGLPTDPSVGYHLGRAYAATGRNDAATGEYERARALLANNQAAYPTLASNLDKAQSALGQ